MPMPITTVIIAAQAPTARVALPPWTIPASTSRPTKSEPSGISGASPGGASGPHTMSKGSTG